MKIIQYHLIVLNPDKVFDKSLFLCGYYVPSFLNCTKDIVLLADYIPLHVLKDIEAVTRVTTMFGIEVDKFLWFHKARVLVDSKASPDGWVKGDTAATGPLWFRQFDALIAVGDLEDSLARRTNDTSGNRP